jgi:autotransporter strand-loop-strand O-heptosyltransferase
MQKLKVKGHTAFIGTTGFNSHAQKFFTQLSRLRPVEIRNYSVGPTWTEMSDEPHNAEPYVTDEVKKMLTEQTLWVGDNQLQDFPIYKKWSNPGEAEVNIVLNETNHAYFYSNITSKYTIGYNVWEATRQPKEFFERLLQLDEIWVPSKWQRDVTIEQGYPADRVTVVPEGVDGSVFKPGKRTLQEDGGKFTFAIFGRWEPRKATTEMIQAFLEEFSNGEPVELILSVDNQFARDGMQTTEERLSHYGFNDPRLRVIHFPAREEYVNLLQSVNVFVSCSRSEGWNLPLLEAMACGTPSIYSNASGQLEFAEGRGLPVKIKEQIPAIGFNDCGDWYEPDFEDLRKVMRDAYENWSDHKSRALKESEHIRKQFSWEEAARIADARLEQMKDRIAKVNRERRRPDSINYNSIRGAFLEVVREEPGKFKAELIDRSTGDVEFSQVVESNMWIRSNRQYYIDWGFKVTDLKTGKVILDEGLDLKGARVLVAIESKSLGDNLAWMPAAEEFRKKHGCKMICSTFWNNLFQDNYPEIEFILPGSPVSDLKAGYAIGFYYEDEDKVNYSMCPRDMRTQPMQKVAFDILGLDFEDTKPKITLPKVKKEKKITIGIHGTCQTKYWNNPTGWQEVVDWCNQNGYEVVLVSSEPNGFMGNIHPTGVRKLPAGPIEMALHEIESSQAFIGISSGLAWLAWASTTPVIMISGFTENYNEMQSVVRINSPAGKCSGCFNSHRLDPADWNWCPVHKGTHRQFECSKTITSETVIEKLKGVLGLI